MNKERENENLSSPTYFVLGTLSNQLYGNYFVRSIYKQK